MSIRLTTVPVDCANLTCENTVGEGQFTFVTNTDAAPVILWMCFPCGRALRDSAVGTKKEES